MLYKIILILLFIMGIYNYSMAENVALRWEAPVTNVDNTPLMDLDGFKIYYGTASGVYNTNIDVGMVVCTVVTGLTVGITYFFAATAYDVLMNESSYSNEVSKLIATNDVGVCISYSHGKQNFRQENKGISGGFGGGW